MRWVLVFAVVATLFSSTDSIEANGRVFTVAKEHTSALWGRFIHRRQAVRNLLQQAKVLVPLFPLCFGLACGSITQPSVIPAETSYDQPLLPGGGTVMPDVPFKTELFGKGMIKARGIEQDSVSSYLAVKKYLPAKFYDNMLVHYTKDGADFVRILKFNTDSELEVSRLDDKKGDIVDVSQIEAILVGTHDGYETRYLFQPKFAISCNNDEHEPMLQTLPEKAMLYGRADMIFTNNRYLMITNTMFTPDGSTHTYSREIFLMVDKKHAVAVPNDTQPRQQNQPPANPLRQKRTFNSVALGGGEYWEQALAVGNN